MRVLLLDGGVVMYDTWWEHLGNWGLADLQQVKKNRIHYYVTTAGTVLAKAAYVRTEPLSGDEVTLHRPDLPFAFAQCAGVSWPAQLPGSPVQMAAQMRAAGCRDSLDGMTLGAAEVYVFPFGPKGAQKACVRVQADNEAAFTAEELLWKAAAVQALHIGNEVSVPGTGIYRLGLQRGLPSYYLWGNMSQLDSGGMA
jgi:hypothetical protein